MKELPKQFTPVVLYGRSVRRVDVRCPRPVVWCNTSGNDPDSIRSWGAALVFGYLNAGAWQPDSDDAQAWARRNPECMGEPLDGWPEERWLDIRHPDAVEFVCGAVHRVKRLGFDGVDLDNLNLDEIGSATGFRISASDQDNFIELVARVAMTCGLMVSMRHTPRHRKFDPDVWLIEEALEHGFASEFPCRRGNVVTLEYTPTLPERAARGLAAVRVNRSLSKNYETRHY